MEEPLKRILNASDDKARQNDMFDSNKGRETRMHAFLHQVTCWLTVTDPVDNCCLLRRNSDGAQI
jgi:hypothetical protein